MLKLSWIEVDHTQLFIVCISIVMLEGAKLYLQTFVKILQTLLGGDNYRRVMAIERKKRYLEIEKKNYHSVDQFPKIAKLDRKIIQLELEENDIPLSHYVTYGIPILLPILYTVLTNAIYILLIIGYRNMPIVFSSNLLWLHPMVLGILAFPTGVQGGVGAVYVVLAAKVICRIINRINSSKIKKNL